MDGVAVDLADVEVGAHLGDAGGGDSVRGAPYLGGGGGRGDRVRVLQREPVGVRDEGYDAAGGRGGAAVVFAGGGGGGGLDCLGWVGLGGEGREGGGTALRIYLA